MTYPPLLEASEANWPARKAAIEDIGPEAADLYATLWRARALVKAGPNAQMMWQLLEEQSSVGQTCASSRCPP
jgi:hypothetical protein